MEFKYDIRDAGAYAPFAYTMEGTGAGVDGSRVVIEGDNSAARMLAESLVEFGIMHPVMEADGTQGTGDNAGKEVVAQEPATERHSLSNTRARKAPNPADALRKAIAAYVNGGMGLRTDGTKKTVLAKVLDSLKNTDRVVLNGMLKDPAEIKNHVDKFVNGDPELKSAIEEETSTSAAENTAGSSGNVIADMLDKLGIQDDGSIMRGLVELLKDGKVREKVAGNQDRLKLLLVNVIKKDGDLFNSLVDSGAFENIGLNVKSDGTVSRTGTDDGTGKKPDVIEVPDAFKVEPDDSEWENAVITAFGFPMVNLSSPLVIDMLRASDPASRKRAYKELTGQMKKEPAIANALGIGVLGKLGFRRSGQSASDGKNVVKLDSVGDTGASVLLESDNGGKVTPIDVLRKIARPKGTPCRRNPLMVRYEEVNGKDAGSNTEVTVTPLGVTGGILRDNNVQVGMPFSHLVTFYSVIDPNVSFNSYVKAYAEVDYKNKAGFGSFLKSQAGKDKAIRAGMENAAKELKKYMTENGHPPFYLMKARGNPKEVDRWSDEDAKHGYQMITMDVGGHKAGMFLKEKVAKALFKVG